MDLLTIKRTGTDKTDNNTIFFFEAIHRDSKSTKQYVKFFSNLTLSEKPSYQNDNESKECFWKGF